jgi:hypothetical protein
VVVRAGAVLGEVPHADVAELDEVAVGVVLQADEATGELPQVGGRVTRARGVLAGRVVELVEDFAVADDRVVLAADPAPERQPGPGASAARRR